ncbi:MAG TPA: hypothetical protein VI793_07535 [Anaerolineales bacterium]|nr:hypothetical protein [Anaerolineales bacterium]
MKTTRYLTEEELIERGVEALMKALGPVETARFLNLRSARRLESVKRHRRWQARLNKKQFFDQVFGGFSR